MAFLLLGGLSVSSPTHRADHTLTVPSHVVSERRVAWLRKSTSELSHQSEHSRARCELSVTAYDSRLTDIPKTGSSIATTLFRYANESFHYANGSSIMADYGGWSCNGTFGRTLTRPKCDMTRPIVYNAHTGEVESCTPCYATIHATLMAEAYPYDTWFRDRLSAGDEMKPYDNTWFGDHFGLNQPFVDKWDGHIFTMVRDPMRLRISNYQRQQEFDLTERGYTSSYPKNYSMTSATTRPHPMLVSLLEYAKRNEAELVSYLSTDMRYGPDYMVMFNCTEDKKTCRSACSRSLRGWGNGWSG